MYVLKTPLGVQVLCLDFVDCVLNVLFRECLSPGHRLKAESLGQTISDVWARQNESHDRCCFSMCNGSNCWDSVMNSVQSLALTLAG